jgi:hypothetical protein
VGAFVSYRKDASDDLLVTLQPVNRDEGLPHVWRLDGVSEYPAEKEEHILLEELAAETARQIESFEFPGSGPLSSLVYDCSRMLQIEAAIGDPPAALRSCALAKEKLLKWSRCAETDQDCDAAASRPLVRMIDKRLAEALQTDTYRKYANTACCVTKSPKD